MTINKILSSYNKEYVLEARSLRDSVLQKLRQWEDDGLLSEWYINSEFSSSNRFAKLLNYHEYSGNFGLSIFRTDQALELIPKLRLLNGPHGLTVMKAMLLKKESENDPN